MNLSDILIEIQENLQTGDVLSIVSALRQDAVVWQEIQSNDLIIKNLKFLTQGDSWKPGILALLALLEKGEPVSALINDLTSKTDEGLTNRALNLYETAINRDGSLSLSLADAGYLALALRERGRVTGNWCGLVVELGLNTDSKLDFWQTPLNCLFSLIDHPEKMCIDLLQEMDTQAGMRLVSRMILSNRQSLTEKVTSFIETMKGLTSGQKVSWLNLLKISGERDIIPGLTAQILEAIPLGDEKTVSVDFDSLDAQSLLNKTFDYQQMASLYQLSGQSEMASSMLEKARDGAYHFIAGLDIQSLEMEKGTGKALSEEGLIEKVNPALIQSKKLQTEYALAMGAKPESKFLKNILAQSSQNPFVAFQKAAAELDGAQPEKAIASIRGAALRMIGWIKDNQPFKTGQFLTSWEPAYFIRILHTIGLNQEAYDLTRLFLKIRPNDPALIEWAALLGGQEGLEDDALGYGLMSILYNPENPNSHRQVAELFEKQDQYQSALKYRLKVLELDEDEQNVDWLALANCALKAEDYMQAVNACNQVINQERDNPQATSILGQALYKQGENTAAEACLKKAIRLLPEDTQNWLALADIYRRSNTTQQLFETLRSAIKTNPDSAEINYELAQTCLEQGKKADAMPFLKKAAGLKPESVNVSLKLGETLRSIGHLTEASQALQNGRQHFPNNSDVALSLAQTLFFMGEMKSAIPSLDVVMKNGNPGYDEYSMYLKALFGVQSDPIKPPTSQTEEEDIVRGQEMLGKVLALKPDDFYARIIKAEILAASGQMDEAYDIYQSLIDHPDAMMQDWQGRIFSGFGKTALALNQIETALAVLKEACQACPNNIYLQRTLAEVYYEAGLLEKATETAQYVLELAPTRLDNLAWYADMAIQLKDEAEAIKTLNFLVEQDPDSAGSWIKLAKTEIDLNHTDNAHRAIKSLLLLDRLSPDDWRQAAYLYLSMDDPDAMASCFDQATVKTPDLAEWFNFEQACILKYKKDYKNALDAIQKAIEIAPLERAHYILEADLMALMGRKQAALACLTKAMKFSDQMAADKKDLFRRKINQFLPILPDHWLDTSIKDAGIDVRFAFLNRQMGNWPDALAYAEKAVEGEPDIPAYRYLVVDLANGLLETDKAKEYLQWLEDPEHPEGRGTLKKFKMENIGEIVSLASQWAEMVLDEDEEILAGRIVQQLISLAQDSARVIGNQVRMLARQGQKPVADEIAEKVKPLLSNQPKRSEKDMVQDFAGMELVQYLENERPFWLGKMLVDLDRYDEALALLEKTANHKADALGNLEFAKTIVKAAEKRRLLNELKCSTHVPTGKVLSKEYLLKFEKATELAAKIHHSPQVEEWILRGKAVFNPSSHNIHLLSRHLENGGDIAPLAAALRQTGNLSGAVSAADKLGDTAEDLLQGALCQQEQSAETGLSLCQKALGMRNNNPVYYSAYALMAEKAGQKEKALESLETALGLWDDEPEWHAWAAQLADEIKPDENQAFNHKKKAYQQRPDNPEYAIRYAESLLARQEPIQALQMLEKAVKGNPGAESLWTSLAKAQASLGKYGEAYQSAEKALKISPTSVQNLLLAGDMALKTGQGEAAADFANEVLKADPDNENAILFASQAFTHNGNHAKSLKLLQKTLQASPDSFRVKLEQARVLRKMNNMNECTEIIDQIIQDYPNEYEPLSLLAEIDAEKNQIVEAKQAAHRSLQINKNQPELLLLLGKMVRQSGQLDQAVEYFSQSVQLAPNLIDSYLNLGETYQERREAPEALKVYQLGIEKNPQQSELYYQAAILKRDMKDYPGAEAMLRKAAELAPKDLNIRRQLGAIIALNLVHNSQEANRLS